MAISVVEVPRQVPVHEGIRVQHHREAILTQARKVAADRKKELLTRVIIAHHASDGLRAAVTEHKAAALVMGWKGFTNTRDRFFGEVADSVIRHADCDLILVKFGKKEVKMHNCLLPTAGGPNAQLAASVLSALAAAHDMTVTAGHVLPPGATDEQRENARKYLDITLERLDSSIDREERIIESRSIAGGIAKAGRDYDLVVIGAAKEPLFRKMLFGEIPEKVARFSPSNVMVVKQYEGPVKSILKRILG
jgi:nucleotide-binding universal stress UspA family protein